MMEQKSIPVRIRRQSDPNGRPYWEEFRIPYQAGLNVISLLEEIRRHPETSEGKSTTPVAWDCGCLEELCGACTMVINGTTQQACTALVDRLAQPVVLEPMSKFPIMRDLCVDRVRLFEGLKKLRAWVDMDGIHDLGPGPRVTPETQQEAYALATCMTCGCCLDVCPQVNSINEFIGPAAIAQARLFNLNPIGAIRAAERNRVLMETGGIHECGNAQNCVKACPAGVPLVSTISRMNRSVLLQGIKDALSI